jgi:hypothetical protein
MDVEDHRALSAVRLMLTMLGLLVVLALPGCAAPGVQSADRPFGYAVPINPYDFTEQELRRALDLAEEAGVNTISTGVAWWYVAPERSPESYRWDPLDLLVEEAERRDLRLYFHVSGTPDWVHPDLDETVPDGARRVWYPPQGDQELEYFSDFMRTLVGRYGSDRIDGYEVWNEPNSEDFWSPTPDPNGYAALLRSAYLSAKEADPEAKVMFGGLSRNDVGFLNRYYEAAKQYPEAEENGHFFDVLDVHPYTDGQSPDWAQEGGAIVEAANGPLDRSFGGMKTMKSAMERNGEPNKPIFIGEFGYSTTDTFMQAVPEYRRAFYLKRAYEIVRELPYVLGMSWYSYIPGSSVGEEWTILNESLDPSTTYRALKQTTGAESSAAEVTLPQPREPVSGDYSVEPNLVGVSEADASGWEIFVDGNPFGPYRGVPFEWDTRQAEDGTHTLTLVMYTKDGSVWPSDPVALDVRND